VQDLIDYGVLLFVLPRKEKTPEHDDEDEDLTTVFVAAAIIVVIVALFILLWSEGASAVAFAFVWAMEKMVRFVTELIGVWGRFLNEIWNPGSR
jgi:hypothetical protein